MHFESIALAGYEENKLIVEWVSLTLFEIEHIVRAVRKSEISKEGRGLKRYDV